LEGLFPEKLTVGSISPDQYAEFGVTREMLLSIYRKMVLIRTFEEEAEQLYVEKGVLGGLSHLYLGQEAIASAASEVLRPGDEVLGTYRGHGHALALGIPPREVMAELYGKEGGVARGLAGSMHVIMEPKRGALYSTAIVGSHVPIAVGVAYAMKYRRSGAMAMVFFGDGTVNTGSFMEGLNMAWYLKAPVMFVCENNQYAEFSSTYRMLGGGSIAGRSRALGVPAEVADGNDPLSVLRGLKLAENSVRKGEGPALLEAITYRSKGHNPYDPATYRPKEEVDKWAKRDPIALFESRLLSEDVLDTDLIRQVRDWAKEQVADAEKYAESDPVLPFEDIIDYV